MSLLWKPGGISLTGPTWLAKQIAMSDATYWVDSATGSDSTGTGEEWLPFATVFGAAGAIASCTDLASNLVVCKTTHRETVSSAYTWAKAGITLVSLGTGTARATFTSSVVGAMATVTGVDVRVENCNFAASSAATTRRFSATVAGFEMRDCLMYLGANDAADGVLVNAATGASFRGCTFKATGRPAGTAQVGLRVTGASSGVLMEDCTFDGGGFGFTGSAAKVETNSADRFRMRSCTLQNYAVAKISVSGIKGLTSYTTDATSRLEWAE